MSYDIYFCRKTKEKLFLDEVVRWSQQYRSFKQTSETQLFYESEETGVYFYLEYATPDERDELDIPPDIFSTGLSFNLNYGRPTFFALEAMPIVASLAHCFDLEMFDPQRSPSLGQFTGEELVESWSSSNASAAEYLVTQGDLGVFYLSRARAQRFWSYMTAYPQLNEALKIDDVFVPKQFLVSIEDPQRADIAFVWTLGIHLVIPSSDWTIVVFPKTLWRTQTRMLCFRSEAIFSRLNQYISEYDDKLGLWVLPPKNVVQADKILKRLKGGINFSEAKRVSPDKCIDVPFGKFKPV